MKEPNVTTIKRLFAASGNVCAYPGCNTPIVEESGTITGEICHIKARSENGPRYDKTQTDNDRHSYSNLILLCGRHHRIIDKEPEIYDVESLVEIKKIHEQYRGRKETKEDSLFARFLLNGLKKVIVNNNSGNIMVDSPGSIQATTVNIKSSKQNINVLPPSGSIGANSELRAYIEYLIERYNKFASSDPTRKTKFKYGALGKNIKDKFGKKWQLLGEHESKELIDYLQSRITKTRLAKINKGKGHKSFSTFEEFKKKYKKTAQQIN